MEVKKDAGFKLRETKKKITGKTGKTKEGSWKATKAECHKWFQIQKNYEKVTPLYEITKEWKYLKTIVW